MTHLRSGNYTVSLYSERHGFQERKNNLIINCITEKESENTVRFSWHKIKKIT